MKIVKINNKILNKNNNKRLKNFQSSQNKILTLINNNKIMKIIIKNFDCKKIDQSLRKNYKMRILN